VAVQAVVVLPVDPFDRRVFDIVDGAKWASQERAAAADGFVLNSPIVVFDRAWSHASPTLIAET
jgi:hypothetical protein